ncbi:hypothetical protein I8752_14460 [Nostocaceae cyanobacterium CENA369]|uniref:Uncharacterized protein n=1 Tax=Dendronalium phyllosphericum CENA369 TaxID=1725256 RepID=A0A8J7I829_9NOST|nr:hypothetical protein [Dendronalium phyllosphericum CENA369]
MLKLNFKSIAILFSSFAVVLSVCQSASAKPVGLDIGGRNRIPPGQEQEFLRYQLDHNNDLRQIRVIPECNVGFGLSCNKTGTILEQIVRSNGGPSYDQMLMRAAGGPQNYQNFTAFYGNSSKVYDTPYISFWREQQSAGSILDSSQYVIGQSVSRTPVAGLGTVTKKFAWSPLTTGDKLDTRSGLLDLKYSYGRVLLNEVAKIPNTEQQIRSLDLPPDMTQYYLTNLSRGLNALKTGNEQALQDSILKIFSFPYSPVAVSGSEYGRVPIAAADQLALQGIPLSGETLSVQPVFLAPVDIVAAPDAPVALEELVPAAEGGGFNFPILPVLGGLGLVALLLALGGGDDSSSQASSPGNTPVTDVPPPVTNVPPPTPNPPQCIPPGGNATPGNGQVIGVPCDTNVPPPPEVKKVIEPSTLKAILLLTLVMFILSRKYRSVQIKG